MGFLDRFRKKRQVRDFPAANKPEKRESAAAAAEPWVTNAPEDWPIVHPGVMPPMPPNPDGTASPFQQLSFAAAIATAFENPEIGKRLARISGAWLLDDGVLPIPVEIEDGERRIPVFFYPENRPAAAWHWAGVRSVLSGRHDGVPVYFCPEALPDAEPGEVLRPFGPDLLSEAEGDLPEGDYSVWWASEGDDDPRASETLRCVDQTYQAFDRIETYATGLLLKELGGLDEGESAGRVALPDDLYVLPFDGPEGIRGVFSVSAEKGLRFHLHSELVSELHRELFWKHIAGFGASLREALLEQGLPLDDASEESPAKWWSYNRAVVAQMMERGESPQQIGTVPNRS